MNYLMVMPQTVKSNDESYVFPLGIAYVSSSLKLTGRNVFTLNLNYKNRKVEQLVAEWVQANDIDVIAVGGLTRQYHDIVEILTAAKSANRKIIALVGGGIITSDPVNAMVALNVADIGMIGEGERTICELADAIEGKRELASVDGIIYKCGDRWETTAPREEIQDLDAIAFPDYEGFEFGESVNKASIATGFGGAVAYIVMSRSCPNNCTFCFHPSGSRYRTRSVANVLAEIDDLKSKYPMIETIRFSDEMFGINVRTAYELCNALKERGLRYSVQMRVDRVNDEIMQLMKDTGCVDINYGLESACNDILKSMRKCITIEQSKQALDLALKYNIHASGGFIFGDIAETKKTAEITLKWWKEHPQYDIALSNIICFPGTAIYKYACEKGIIENSVNFIKDGCPYVNVSKMSDEEYKELMQEILILSRNERKKEYTMQAWNFYAKGRISMKVTCNKCGMKTEWKDVIPFAPNQYKICSGCGAKIDIVEDDEVAETVNKNIGKIEKKIAFWPVNGLLQNMVKSIEGLKRPNVYFIDESVFKQGNYLGDKRIFSSKIIVEKDIRVIFITHMYIVGNDIVNYIKENYKNVEYIFYATELTDEAFGMEKSRCLYYKTDGRG